MLDRLEATCLIIEVTEIVVHPPEPPSVPARRPSTRVHEGGRDRSEFYTRLFRFSKLSDVVRDFEKIGTRPQDFTLMISNPLREGQQPSRVAIQLVGSQALIAAV